MSPHQPTLEQSVPMSEFPLPSISPYLEMGAYETLWMERGASLKTISEKFRECPGCLPSDFVDRQIAIACADSVKTGFNDAGIRSFGIRIHGTLDYPARLRDAQYPLELFYYQGCWDLADSPSVAVVGTRKPTKDGVIRTRSLVRKLVADDYTVVSGLAAGVDSVAHRTAITENGRTFAVIGTPLSSTYPRENRELQQEIAERFLLISQVPLKRYEAQTYRANRYFFPQRNVTMAAITQATVIVEAGDTSGTRTQAREALRQGRPLFIFNSCFDKATWPAKMEERGAIRVRSYDDIRENLAPAASSR